MKNSTKRIFIPLLIVLFGTVLCIGLGLGIQLNISRNVFEESSAYFFERLESALEEREKVLDETRQYNDGINSQLLYNMSFLFEGGEILKKDEQVFNSYELQLEKLRDKSGLDQLMIVEPDGKILLSSSADLKGRTLQEFLGVDAAFWEIVKNSDFLGEDDQYQYGYAVKAADGSEKLLYSYPVFTEDSDDACAYFTGVSDDRFMQQIRSDSRDLSLYFEPLAAYDGITGFAVDRDTETVLFTSRDQRDLAGRTLEELGITVPPPETDGVTYSSVINGKDCNVSVRHFDYDGLGNWVIFCTDTQWAVVKMDAVSWLVLLFLAVGLLVLFTMNSYRGAGRARMFRSAFVTVVAALLVVIFGVRYIYSMSATSLAMEQVGVNDDAFIQGFTSNRALSNSVKEYYQNRSLMTLDTLATYIENYEDEVLEDTTQNKEYYTERTADGTRQRTADVFGNDLYGRSENFSLDMLAGDIGASSLQILNGNGKTIASSNQDWYYDLSTGDRGYEEQLMQVLDHKLSGFYSLSENSRTGVTEEVYALPIRIFMKKGENGETVILNSKDYRKAVEKGEEDVIADDGLILATGRKPQNVYRSETSIALRTMESITAAQASRMAVVLPEEGTVLNSTEDFPEGDVKALGFLESYDGRESYRFRRLDGKKVFAGIVPCGAPYALITVFDWTEMMGGSVGVIAFTAGFMLLVLLLMSVWFIKNEPVQPEEKAQKVLVIPQSELKYSGIRDYFGRMDSHDKTKLFIKCCFLIVFLAMILRMLITRQTGSSDLAFRYSMSENWEKGVHLFSLTFVFYICLGVFTVMYLAQTLVKCLVPMLGSGTETMVSLVLSILEYIGVIVLIFYNLYLFGVQMGTVVTSAGIMSIVIGLGANSLISDVLAGLFIIVEHEYKVGDIVTIDNFTGFVRSIGLRTTKIQDFSGNIKTFNNSKINGVLNLTDNYTTFFVTMGISTEVPVEEMEQLVNVDLKERMKDDPELVAGPWFSGIPEVKGSSYSISIGASSLQQHAWSLRKRIIQEMLLLMKEKGIRMS